MGPPLDRCGSRGLHGRAPVTYLLDTAPFLWAVTDPGKLSRKARRICESQRETLVFSVASLWEIMIKCGVGGLRIANPARTLPDWVAALGARVLAVEARHAYNLHGLPSIHRDPFDRILVAQAIAENLPLLTCDQYIQQYSVRCVW
jgi:PIN domain nuclease of toxin-antitoxin system